MKVVVTGANGFLGKNLTVHLSTQVQNIETVVRGDSEIDTIKKLETADIIFHFAGENRPSDSSDFISGNVDFTKFVTDNCKPNAKLIFSSSTQAPNDNPYGKSKLAAEEILRKSQPGKNLDVRIYRLPNLFGKWGRPDYNSVVATFCYNIARSNAVQINDPNSMFTLAYVDDVVQHFLSELESRKPGVHQMQIEKTYPITVGDLAEKIASFKRLRDKFELVDSTDDLNKKLYATYLSYVPETDFARTAQLNVDDRGHLFEVLKNEDFGQIFLSTTKPGITRGNHFHHTKVEKFCVVKGEGVIRFRNIFHKDVISYAVSGSQPQVVDIPPGYTHNIENVGQDEMITLFWANEIFNQKRPDTTFESVDHE